ncbi:adenosylmethionine-8-amino-7-oxononanoate aminotransferase [Nonomuraea solani]|uniref:Adenosylmethionine-8-amino-7-oxononanoate aminotransferase n=2 Tax=Nonomuraea solani TaxID=1144553 RepID=A0A1H6EF52_9ACTN|nr:adenosylmethionine-8-amino-7-oxononanoate aminotransferase [Nonomuraea solani]
MKETMNWQFRDARAVWHPYTRQQDWLSDDPLVIERAEGVWLTDVSGRRFLDACGSLWVTTYRHGEPRLKAAVSRQLEELDHSTFFGATHTPGIRLAERLVELAPASESDPRGLTRVFFGSDGASMVDAALKLAYQFSVRSGRPRDLILHLENSFHGDSIAASSIMGGEQSQSAYGPLLMSTRRTTSPAPADGLDPARAAARALDDLEKVLAGCHERCCALIVEAMVQAAGGMLPYHPAFLQGCRELADRYGFLLICDEIAAGVARTGQMWATQHAGIVPDVMLCGKGLTGGVLPMSALLTGDHVADAFTGPGATAMFFHGHTYAANPLACAAALENLAMAQELDLPAVARDKGAVLGALLEPVAKHHAVREVRRLGVMTGIELAASLPRAGFRVCAAAQERGVWMRALGDVLVVMPPLAITDDELAQLTAVIEASLEDVFGR